MSAAMADTGDISRARICIDFGTALSKAAVCLDPTLPLEVGVKPLPIGAISGAEHPLLTPSVVYVDGGRLYFGPMGFEHARRGVENGRDPLLSFKTVLGAKNLDEALATKIKPSVDPTGTFTHRDILVVYLAYLDQLIAEALELAPNMPPGTALARRRYTSPVWRPGSGIEQVFERIFNEAAAISFKLGRQLLSREGVSIAQCKDALDKASSSRTPRRPPRSPSRPSPRTTSWCSTWALARPTSPRSSSTTAWIRPRSARSRKRASAARSRATRSTASSSNS
jgi:hypothetical protein